MSRQPRFPTTSHEFLRICWFLGAMLFVGAQALLAQQTGPPGVTSQRSSFTYGTTTTAPGSVETEFGTLGPWDTFTLPTSFKFTPPTETGLFHGMEFSLSFDTVERMVQDGSGDYQFSQTLDFAIRRPVYVGKNFSFALAPRAEFYLRDGAGANVGGVAIAAYAFGLNSVAVNLTGKAATAPSKVTPWEVDIAYGYGRSFGESGLASRFSLAVEAQHEFPDGSPNKTSLLQSVSYSIRPNLAFDVGVEQHGLQAGDFQWVFRGGFAYNFGYLWRR